MANQRERRKWALQLAAALLRSDMDTYVPEDAVDEFDDDEGDKRIAAVRQIADELESKAERIHLEKL